jgi:hypothetical protein
VQIKRRTLLAAALGVAFAPSLAWAKKRMLKKRTAFALVDIGTSGWTVNQWTTVNTGTFSRTHASQPGSRFYFIDPSQTVVTTELAIDEAAEFYLWDGTNIIDQAGSTTDGFGQAYGTDPRHPNPLATIKAYKRWAHCGPRNASGDVGVAQDVGRQNPDALMRNTGAFNDGWFFKRGTTYQFDTAMTSWRSDKAMSPTMPSCGLMTPQGISATHRMYVGSYGPLTVERATITQPCGAMICRLTSGWNHVLYQDLIFDGLDRAGPNYETLSPASTGGAQCVRLLGNTSGTTDLVFEGCWVLRFKDGFALGANSPNQFLGKVTLFRCVVSDAWATNNQHAQGVFFTGTSASQLDVQQCLLYRNGFKVDPTAQASAQPDGVGSWVWNDFGRNFYISGRADNLDCLIINNTSLLGGSGDQVRCGMRVEQNFFYQGYFMTGAAGGYPPDVTASGSLIDNVLQRYKSTVSSSTAHPGWGFLIGGGAYGVDATRNIFTIAQDSSADTSGVGYGFRLPALWQDNTQGFTVRFQRATTNVDFHDNIIDCVAASAVEEEDGETNTAANWWFQWMSPITGTVGEGNVLTCTPVAGYTGSPSYEWYKNSAAITGPAETASTYTQRAGDTTVGVQISCRVTGHSYAGGPGGLVGNLVRNNIFSVASGTESRYTRSTGVGTPPTVTDTTYSGNTIYSGASAAAAAAAAAAAQGWGDPNRTLKTYTQSLNISVSSGDAYEEFINAFKYVRRGQFDDRFTGKRINNYIRQGRNMAVVS